MKTIFCEFLDSQDKDGAITIKPLVGIFACRCPQRPNRIAISTVELVKRKRNSITVKGLDILDGTPILDIKPYTPQYDRVGKAKVPNWVSKLVF